MSQADNHNTTNLSRRVVLAGLSSVAAAPAVAGMSLASTGIHPDSSLIELAGRLVVAYQRWMEAAEKADDIFGQFIERNPEPPKALERRHDDPVGGRRDDSEQHRLKFWCIPEEIEARRRTQMTKEEFTATRWGGCGYL